MVVVAPEMMIMLVMVPLLLSFLVQEEELERTFLCIVNPGDKEWKTQRITDIYDLEDLHSMLYFKGKMYIMCKGNDHLEIDVQHGSSEHDGDKILSIRKFQVSDYIGGYTVGGIFDTRMETYYVESFDEIFRIKKVILTRGVYDYVTNMVTAKLDFSSMFWVDVKRLDDHVLFLSQSAALCCLTKELGFTQGCVYFTQLEEMSFYKYDLEGKSIMLSVPCPDLPQPWLSPEWIMIPTTFRVGDKRRGTECVFGNSGDRGDSMKEMEKGANLNTDEEKKDIEEARPWVTLGDDIVWSISSYLSPLDYMHLRAVRRTYRSVFPVENWRRFCPTRSLKTTDLSPWLVFAKDNEAVYNFINPMHNNENYLMSIPELLKGSTIRFSKDGWLLLSKGYYSLFFYNPFTKAIVKLPDLPDDNNYQFRGISFSSLPTSSDCSVFAISNYRTDEVSIAFIKRGDEMWTCDILDNVYLPPGKKDIAFEPTLNCPVFSRGAFYCLDLNGSLGVFKLEENGITWDILSMVPRPTCGFIYKSYLVELEGKLLSVLLGHFGKWVRIFRLDMSAMVWVEVEDLGRHVVFISNTSCIATVAPTSRMENKIYFSRLQNEKVLFFSLDSGKYHSLDSKHYGKDYSNSTENLRCSWIEPNWSETRQPSFDWSQHL
ncbi:F-box/kelch-repeat protein At1g57790-like isoform X2 [Papaver somniferum]|uniref:F-box/kelch-repeat protein At1g57790-like isoform X2 n=1 Tax=Papaver somniferum TaxID=3469 RepID=UPI000E701D54|nr:F-box/kelch-repeat protein At1g57790-like isoform X2 [Papaver somniferum]